MSDNNPMAYLLQHLEFMTREQVLQQMVNVWQVNQDRVRFESFLYRLLHLRRTKSAADFMLQASELVLWFGERQPYEKSVPHRVNGEILESYLLKSASNILKALSDFGATWRLNIQHDIHRAQISEPGLNWKGNCYPWQKVAKVADTLEEKRPWKAAVYLRVYGEPYQVMWINMFDNTMSICNLRGGCRVDKIENILKIREQETCAATT